MRRAWLFLLAVGCAGGEPAGYEASFRYPARRDPVVVRPPAAEPAGLPPAGRLDACILNLPAAGGQLIHPAEASDAERAALTATLEELFGTPAAPSLPPAGDGSGFDLSAKSLAAGAGVYATRCASCHGFAGDGRGPVGPITAPYPRDFRAGAFKVATGGHKPTAGQLVALLKRGVPGSAMPLFDLLPEADLSAAAAYLVHLSVRGEAEAAGLRAAAEGDDSAAAARSKTTAVLATWAEPRPVDPPVPTPQYGEPGYAEAVRRGRELFHSPAGGCASCHQDYGRTETYRYDVWGAPLRVADLTKGEFRWGRDDPTLASRVRHGIPAAGMPASPHLTTSQVGDLVAFVRDLSAPARLPADVRAAVYPQAVSR